MENLGQYQQLVASYATEFGTKVIAVILFWLVGRWLIGLVGLTDKETGSQFA